MKIEVSKIKIIQIQYIAIFFCIAMIGFFSLTNFAHAAEQVVAPGFTTMTTGTLPMAFNLTRSSYHRGETIKLDYDMVNPESTTRSYKITQQVFNKSGRLMTSHWISFSLKKDATFKKRMTEYVGKNWKVGEYALKVQVVDLKTKTVLSESRGSFLVK